MDHGRARLPQWPHDVADFVAARVLDVPLHGGPRVFEHVNVVVLCRAHHKNPRYAGRVPESVHWLGAPLGPVFSKFHRKY